MAASSSTHGFWRSTRHPLLAALLALDLVLLLLQYALGILVNLYVQVPFGAGAKSGMGGMMAAMLSSGLPLLMWHMMNGMLLFALTLITVMGAILSGHPRLIAASSLGFGSVTAAAIGGMGFLLSGGGAGYSLLMSMAFLASLLSLIAAFSLAWRGRILAPGTATPPTAPTPVGLVEQRYARGEITRETYLLMRDDLGPESPPRA